MPEMEGVTGDGYKIAMRIYQAIQINNEFELYVHDSVKVYPFFLAVALVLIAFCAIFIFLLKIKPEIIIWIMIVIYLVFIILTPCLLIKYRKKINDL